jgi:hypothetical protein
VPRQATKAEKLRLFAQMNQGMGTGLSQTASN